MIINVSLHHWRWDPVVNFKTSSIYIYMFQSRYYSNSVVTQQTHLWNSKNVNIRFWLIRTVDRWRKNELIVHCALWRRRHENLELLHFKCWRVKHFLKRWSFMMLYFDANIFCIRTCSPWSFFIRHGGPFFLFFREKRDKFPCHCH